MWGGARGVGGYLSDNVHCIAEFRVRIKRWDVEGEEGRELNGVEEDEDEDDAVPPLPLDGPDEEPPDGVLQLEKVERARVVSVRVWKLLRLEERCQLPLPPPRQRGGHVRFFASLALPFALPFAVV